MVTASAFTVTLTRMDGRWSLPEAARELAAAGVRVFPCVPGGKRPLTERGFHDATTDAAQVEAWWRQHPGANIGVPTGATSGLVVVDVDVHGPTNGYAAFGRAARAGLVSGWQMLVNTPSGGLHAYYPADADGVQRCWQAARAGIDFRGDGGYVVVPPSTVRIDGTPSPYRVRSIGTGPGATLDAEGLRNSLDPQPAPKPRPATGFAREADVSRLAAWVASRGEGERNRGLFWAACRLAENGVPATDALDVLTAAAGHAGLGEREVATTVRSAFRTAGAGPRARRLRAGGGTGPSATTTEFGGGVATRHPVRARGM